MWPPHSPDLNPLDYVMWGAIEAIVWQNKIQTMDELKTAIVRVWEEFPQATINRSLDSFRKRLKLVVEADGGNIERYL